MNAFIPHKTLLDALIGQIVVIKYGGNAMTDPELQMGMMRDLVQLQQWGVRPLLVHGGGPQIDAALAKIGHHSEFIDGMRKTDATTLQVAQWVLVGEVQQHLVGLIQSVGGRAVGVSGRDGQLFCAQKLNAAHDLGFVGEVTQVNPHVILTLLNAGYIPVVSSIAQDAAGQVYNINADAVCGQLACALSAHKLVMFSNISGVLDAKGALLAHLDGAAIARLIDAKVIYGGMLPKIAAALEVARGGVQSVHIADGREPHVILRLLVSDEAIGTEIRQ